METIRLLFSDKAKKPLPVKVLISLIGIEHEFGIEGHGVGGEHSTSSFPTLTRDQLLRLFMAGIQEKDSVDELASIINSHIKKLEDSGLKPTETHAAGPGPAEGGAGAQV